MQDSFTTSANHTMRDVEIEIDSKFFTEELVPAIHQTMMSNVKIESYTFFNLILSLKLATQYGSISLDEYHYIVNQLITLKEFWKWRDPQHSFLDMKATVDKKHMQTLKALLLPLYPETTR